MAIQGLPAEAAKRSRSKLPPRVTHYILIQPWEIYCISATAGVPGAEDGWLSVVAKDEEDARKQGLQILGRMKRILK